MVTEYVNYSIHLALFLENKFCNNYGPISKIAKYCEEVVSQGSKMFWAGAFGMKSAVRQSFLQEYYDKA